MEARPGSCRNPYDRRRSPDLRAATHFHLVFIAEILHGVSGGIVGPPIAAISLGIVGRRCLSVRIGRNNRFSGAGNALTALLLGLLGTYIAKSSIFFATAALTIPTLLFLRRIRSEEIDYIRARNAVKETRSPPSQQYSSGLQEFPGPLVRGLPGPVSAGRRFVARARKRTDRKGTGCGKFLDRVGPDRGA